MHAEFSSALAGEALARAMEHWESRHRPGRSEPSGSGAGHLMTIAISREAGTCGAAVARAVGERLGWTIYDHELLELLARDLHVHVKLLESVDERNVPWFQECVEAIAAVPTVREATYVHHLVETLLSLGAHGR